MYSKTQQSSNEKIAKLKTGVKKNRKVVEKFCGKIPEKGKCSRPIEIAITW